MSFKKRNALLITILFMTCFSLYQIYFLAKLSQQTRTDVLPFNQPVKANRNEKKETTTKKDKHKYTNNGILRGVLEHDYFRKYNTAQEFKCLDGKMSIPFEWLNDDYCDCEDGSDEPSTNACLKGIFYCDTQPFEHPIFVHTSKVNDGICDCCDGSDEWLSKGLVLTQYSKHLHRQYSKSCLNICNVALVQ